MRILTRLPAANVDCSPNVVDRERKRTPARSSPIRDGVYVRAVKTERQRFGGELTPEIIPFLPAFETKSF